MKNNKYKSEHSDPFLQTSKFRKALQMKINHKRQNSMFSSYQEIIKENLENYKRSQVLHSMRQNGSQSAHDQFSQAPNRLFTQRTNRQSLQHSSLHKRFKYLEKKQNKYVPIEHQMKEQHNLMKKTLMMNRKKMNQSFLGCLQTFINDQKSRRGQNNISECVKMGVGIQPKSKKLIATKETQVTLPVLRKNSLTDCFLSEQNLFNIQIQSTSCFDGIFPLFRNGSAVGSIGRDIYLFGGIGNKMCQSYNFHKFIDFQNRWVSIKNESKKPMISPCFHTVQSFKNSLLFIGGCTSNVNAKEKVYSSDISLYDIQKKEWGKICWKRCVRSHASTLYGNMLVVFGGFDEKNNCHSNLLFLPLNSNNLSLSTTTPYNLSSKEQGIAFHKMINTFEVEMNLRSKLFLDGIITYGGKLEDGTVCGDVRLMSFSKNKDSGVREIVHKGWDTIKVSGLSPVPRYDHSMSVLNNKAIALVVGGRNAQNTPLNDAWILDLCIGKWTSVVFDRMDPILENCIFSHTSTVVNNAVYIFGGFNKEFKHVNSFWSIDFTYSRTMKQERRTKLLIGSGTTKKVIKGNVSTKKFFDP